MLQSKVIHVLEWFQCKSNGKSEPRFQMKLQRFFSSDLTELWLFYTEQGAEISFCCCAEMFETNL